MQPQHPQSRAPHLPQQREEDVERLPSFITGGQAHSSRRNRGKAATVRMVQGQAQMARMALTDRPTAFRCTGGVAATAGRAIRRYPARATPRILPAGPSDD